MFPPQTRNNPGPAFHDLWPRNRRWPSNFMDLMEALPPSPGQPGSTGKGDQLGSQLTISGQEKCSPSSSGLKPLATKRQNLGTAGWPWQKGAYHKQPGPGNCWFP